MTKLQIFATVGTESKKQFLIDNFGIQPDHIFSSRDSSFLPGILEATSGRGVDVVLNSLAGELLHDSWRACAELGRFVEIGKRDILDNGKLDMDTFRRGATFTAFDLSLLFNSTSRRLNNIWNRYVIFHPTQNKRKGLKANMLVFRLLKQSIQYLREGKIKEISPLKVFDVSDIVQAYRHFQSRTRLGKVAISLEDTASPIQVGIATLSVPACFYLLIQYNIRSSQPSTRPSLVQRRATSSLASSAVLGEV